MTGSYLKHPDIEAYNRYPLSPEEKKEICHKLRMELHQNLKLTFTQTVDRIIMDQFKIDECVNEYTFIIINLLHGEAKRRINHVITKINKLLFTENVKEASQLPDFDNVIFNHFCLLMHSVYQFFNSTDFQVPYKEVYLFSNTVSDKFEWYPCYSKRLSDFIFDLYCNLDSRKIALSNEGKYNELLRLSTSQIKGQEYDLQLDAEGLDNAKHVLNTRKYKNNLFKLLCSIDFPMEKMKMTTEIQALIIKRKSGILSKFDLFKFWAFTKNIIKCLDYAIHSIGLCSFKESKKIDLKVIKQQYLRPDPDLANIQLSVKSKAWLSAIKYKPPPLVSYIILDDKMEYVHPSKIVDNLEEFRM